MPIPPQPDQQPHHYRVRTDRVDTTGVITLRYRSRLHHIGINRAYAETPVTLLIADLSIRIITPDGQVLRELTLDPS